MPNLFDLPPLPLKQELFESLEENTNVKIERIVSTGQITPPGEWYDQEKAEWVVLLKGEAIIEYETAEKKGLKEGDYLFLPAHCKHRVVYTSTEPPCVWLAVHF